MGSLLCKHLSNFNNRNIGLENESTLNLDNRNIKSEKKSIHDFDDTKSSKFWHKLTFFDFEHSIRLEIETMDDFFDHGYLSDNNDYLEFYNKYGSYIDKTVYFIENDFPNDEIIDSINKLYKSTGIVDVFYKKRTTLFKLILDNSRDLDRTYDLCKTLLNKYNFDLNKTFSSPKNCFVNNCNTFLVCHSIEEPNLNASLVKLFFSYGLDLNAIHCFDNHETLYDMLSNIDSIAVKNVLPTIVKLGGRSIYDIDLRYKRLIHSF